MMASKHILRTATVLWFILHLRRLRLLQPPLQLEHQRRLRGRNQGLKDNQETTNRR